MLTSIKLHLNYFSIPGESLAARRLRNTDLVYCFLLLCEYEASKCSVIIETGYLEFTGCVIRVMDATKVPPPQKKRVEIYDKCRGM